MSLLEKVKIQVRKIEERTKDSWLDMGLRSLRGGEVRFYRVTDPLTGKWLFKACSDEEMHKTIIKALKCPSGGGFVQLEGRTMLFQRSLMEGCSYDVISLSYIDKEGRLRRNVVSTIDEVPETIKNNFKIVAYEEATGKKAIGKRLVTICKEKDEKTMIILFLIQRAWPISKIPPNIGVRIFDLLKVITNLERAQIDEIFQTAEERYELTKEDTEVLLRFLETEGKILRSEEYIKTRR
ncbi:MAG: hypothetical protein NWF14_04270 [Candidatus Bathyarchaeota archaeon]|nr:hypothetical protein [Candidatus Bathyarchaeota archaeon]